MSETLEAIPTVWQGRLMKSRLECRWACFFERLGIVAEYEPFRFHVAGRVYVPDFLLLPLGCFVEVKPEAHEPDHDRYQPLVDWAQKPLALLIGPPCRGDYEALLYVPGWQGPERGLCWAVGRRDHSEVWVCSIHTGFARCLSPRSRRLNWPVADCHILREASRQAMGWRFEENE